MYAIQLPEVIFGTSELGKLYVSLDQDNKLAIVSECLILFHVPSVKSIALNTTNPARIATNIKLKDVQIPSNFSQEIEEPKTNRPLR